MKPIMSYIYRPINIAYGLAQHGYLNWLSDKSYIKLIFRMHLGYKPNLNNPRTFNEKLQWLKLHDRQAEYSQMVDKYEAKQYVAQRIGEQYIIPTLGVWEKFDDIDFNTLPKQFVLKCTHDSGGLVICRDKSKLDLLDAKARINKSLKRNYYWISREWPYKNVKPRIIAEKYMQNGNDTNLNVYKIFNFIGEPKLIQTIQNDKQPNETIDYFDVNWELQQFKQNFPNSKHPLSRPELLDEMLVLARKLSAQSPFLRTDFYVVNKEIYFSEITFYSDAGMAAFHPEKWDEILGDWIKIP